MIVRKKIRKERDRIECIKTKRKQAVFFAAIDKSTLYVWRLNVLWLLKCFLGGGGTPGACMRESNGKLKLSHPRWPSRPLGVGSVYFSRARHCTDKSFFVFKFRDSNLFKGTTPPRERKYFFLRLCFCFGWFCLALADSLVRRLDLFFVSFRLWKRDPSFLRAAEKKEVPKKGLLICTSHAAFRRQVPPGLPRPYDANPTQRSIDLMLQMSTKLRFA